MLSLAHPRTRFVAPVRRVEASRGSRVDGRESEATLHQKTILPNGLRVVSAEISHARSVSTSVFVNAGSRHETPETSGISHFIEHMLFKGTERRPTSKEISEAIEGIGGIFNAESGKEATVYWNKVASHHFPLALDVLADLMLHSRFVPDDI
jgi:predicted Zn-dependent peptidase